MKTPWRRRFPGELAAIFLVLYPAFSFFHEFLRGDLRIIWRPAAPIVLTLNQFVSILVLATGLVLWRTLKPARSTPPPFDVHPPSTGGDGA
jgi:prolipoprotein diacylglyceryltransferase